MDFNSLCIGFLTGSLIGASGTYLGNKFTDQRRAKEGKKEENKRFEKLFLNHSKLLKDMKDDVEKPECIHNRIFYIHKKNLNYNLPKGENIIYYVEDHESLEKQIGILSSNSFVSKITDCKYEFSELFIEDLKTKLETLRKAQHL